MSKIDWSDYTCMDVHRDQHAQIKALAEAKGVLVVEMTADLLANALDEMEAMTTAG